MDFAKFKASLDKSREVEVEVDAAKFRMRLPTEHAWRLAYEQHKGTQAHARAVVEASLVGWDGVLARHFLVGAGDEPVPFSADAKAALLDERQDIGDELMDRAHGEGRRAPGAGGGGKKKLIARAEWDLNGEAGAAQLGFSREQWRATRPPSRRITRSS
jgi:hypothetical protein